MKIINNNLILSQYDINYIKDNGEKSFIHYLQEENIFEDISQILKIKKIKSDNNVQYNTKILNKEFKTFQKFVKALSSPKYFLLTKQRNKIFMKGLFILCFVILFKVFSSISSFICAFFFFLLMIRDYIEYNKMYLLDEDNFSIKV